ncbi:MAG: hypothetical protein GQ570_10035 [Helicobacteraceae bacterium]|nr:hypothetical protein [Helicobacteraceae bacterium]
MNLTFKRDKRVLFVDHNDTPFILLDSEKVNIILSPSFYWVQKVTLPVKYLYEVNKLLPALFDDLLADDDSEYSYEAYKKDDYYMAFAYKESVIKEALAKKNIPLDNIDKIYFAQSEFSEIDSALSIDSQSVLILKDELVIKLPLIMVETYKELDLQKFKLSSHNIAIAKYNNIIDPKVLKTTFALALALIVILSIELFVKSSSLNSLEDIESSIYKKASLSSSSRQNNSIYKQLNKTYKEQSSLREAMKLVLKQQLKNDEVIKYIEVVASHLKVEFFIRNKSSLNELLSKLRSHGYKVATYYKNQKLQLDIKL